MNLDRAYENTAFIPDGSSFPARWNAQAEAFRISHSGLSRLDRPYGEGARQKYDLFLPDGPAQGTLIFVHGGYWKAFDKSTWSHLASGAVARGWAVVMPSYTLCPEARIAEIGAEIASVITQIAETSKGPLVLTGHSAGGHLVARAAAGLLPASVMHRIRRVVPISPVADLEPLMHTSMNEILRIDADEALRESPVALAKPDVPVTVWVGGAERPAFIEQAAKLARVWDCGLEIADGRHHFDVIDALDRNGKLLNFLLA